MQLYKTDDVRRYVFGGHGEFTLTSAKTGRSYTYRTRYALAGFMFVSVLTGPENTADYEWIGVLSKDDGRFRVPAKAAPGLPQQKAAMAYLTRFFESGREELPEALEFRHGGTCCRCGRLLTTPESIDLGIGPVCAAKAA